MLIDAGNSRLKWSIKKNGEWSPVAYEEYSPLNRLMVIFNILSHIKPLFIVMAHVLGCKFAEEVQIFCEKKSISLTIIYAESTRYGIKNAYHDASKLGADRFVGLIAVHQQSKKQHKNRDKYEAKESDHIIISCGTAVTIDALNKQGEHLGGVILPGLQLWKDTLIKGTELLQQVDTSTIHILATNTGQGIAAGSLYGLAGAIDRICNEMKLLLTEPVTLVITGGCAESLQPYFTNHYTLSPNLVIQGLKIITENKMDNDSA